MKIPFCDCDYYFLHRIRPLESCHYHYCYWYSVVLSQGTVETLSQVFFAFPCILFSFHHLKSISPAEPFLYPTLLYLFYEKIYTKYQRIISPSVFRGPKFSFPVQNFHHMNFQVNLLSCNTESLGEYQLQQLSGMASLWNSYTFFLSLSPPRRNSGRGLTGPRFGQEVSSFQQFSVHLGNSPIFPQQQRVSQLSTASPFHVHHL